jgi:hypothetical protein
VKATWTYQVPSAGTDAIGLEDYLVETREGEAAGKVIALLDRDGERYVVFDTGNPPVTRRRTAVPWRDVESVDHDTLTVRLALTEGDLAATVELDPANEIEDGEAEAVRVTELPRQLTPSSAPEQGPIDRPTYVGAIALFALGLIALLGLASSRAATTSLGSSHSLLCRRSPWPPPGCWRTERSGSHTRDETSTSQARSSRRLSSASARAGLGVVVGQSAWATRMATMTVASETPQSAQRSLL